MYHNDLHEPAFKNDIDKSAPRKSMGDTSGHDESAPKNWSDRGRHFSNKKHEADKAGKMGGARDWSTRMKRDPKTKEV